MTTTIQAEGQFVVMVNGVMRKQRFEKLEDAVQYVRGMKDGGKSAILLRELPHPGLSH